MPFIVPTAPAARPRQVPYSVARRKPSRFLRQSCLFLSLLLTWTFVLAAPLQALAQQAPPAPKAEVKPPTLHSAPALHIAEGRRTRALPAALRRTDTSPSLLDEVGNFARNVSSVEADGWKRSLRQGHLTTTRAARLHLWVGEWELAKEQHPEAALPHFAAAQQGLPAHHPDRGVAAYDGAMALYFEGAYRQAADAFRALLASRTLRGYDAAHAALWLRHAASCAGYHQQRSDLGIPEPPRLDPLCGVAALAACLRARHLPADKATVLAACRVTGRGSSLADILEAGKRLGVSVRALTADDAGLRAMPLPAVAYVEHDHFVAVVSADRSGVGYLCSDCGPFPGGRVHLTWKQWHALEPTAYAVVTKKDSASDRWLRLVLAATPGQQRDAISQSPSGGLEALLRRSLAVPALLAGHLVALQAGGAGNYICGFANNTLQCAFFLNCPLDCGGPHCDTWGALGGDPVNLATGEEQYTPPADLTVYNPLGASVVWKRLYTSLRGYDVAYEYDDLGQGWSHGYNVGVLDPVLGQNPQVAQSATANLTPNGHDAPGTGLTWDVVLNGQTKGSSSVPNGWSVTYNSTAGTLGVTVPAGAGAVTGYEARYHSGTTTVSVVFDVLPPATVPVAMGPIPVPVTGTDAPAGTATWDITYNSAVIASSLKPNGWNVSLPVNNALPVSAPSYATVGSGYEVRSTGGSGLPQSPQSLAPNSSTGGGAASGPFSVAATRLYPLAGSKSVVEANGARISFTAPSVPTALSPSVACSVQAGAPIMVTWNYSAANAFGSYTLTFADRTQWVTTAPSQFVTPPSYTVNQTTAACYSLSKQIDRNGNALQFRYGAVGPGGFPLLSQIADKTGAALLTLNRATDGTGNLTSVSDRYGRSVSYQMASYANTGVPANVPQAYQELTHVSQVEPTGTANPPDRYAYGYANVANHEGETIPFLHTITVPSPTGTGTSVATLNFAPTTGYVSSIVDGNGNTHSYTFVDNSHCQVKINDSASHLVTSYTVGFDPNMSATTMTNGAVDANGHNTTIVREAIYADPSDPYKPSEVLDGNGYAVNGANGLGKWLFTWDAFGHCRTATSPYGTVTTNTWSYTNFALGELTKVQEGTKQPTTLSYFEPSGNVKQITSPLPGTVGGTQTVTNSATWSTLGNLLTITAPGNNAAASLTTTFNYTADGTYSQAEALGQPIRVTDNLGKSSHLRYNNLGGTLSAVDALGNETDALYYYTGQIQQVTLPATGQSGTGRGHSSYSYQYPDGPPSLVAVYDEGNLGLIRQYTPQYGKEGEASGTTGNLNPYSVLYDGAYRTLSVTDGNSHTTSYAYSPAGYLQSVTYPNSDTLQALTWDDNGNVLTAQNGRGEQFTYQYNDNESRLTSAQSQDASINNSYSYDGYGRLHVLSDAQGSRTFAYDDDNLPSSQVVSYPHMGGNNSFTLSYGYYPNGSRQTLSVSCLPAGSNTFTSTYNGRGVWTGLSNPYGENSSWSYLDNGWLQTQTLGNGATTTASYNAIGQLLDLSNKKSGGTVLSDFSMTGAGHYDGAGNLLSLTASLPGAPASYSGTTSLQYDSHDQLNREQSGRLGSYTNTFAFDNAGNPTTWKGAPQTFNTANQNNAFTYDGDGNPKTWQSSTLTFDAGSHLTAIGTTLTAGYNAEGLRAWKQSAAGTTYFLYDGLTPIVELDNNANVKAVNTWGADGLLSRRTVSTNSSVFYTFDMQGSTAQRLDSGGNILGTYGFDAFGTRASTDNSTDPYSGFGAQFGYYRDSETGLSLCGHRYYDPGQGRWLNRDPIGYAGGLNLYGYVGSNPMADIDPTGLFNWMRAGGDVLAGIAGGIVGGPVGAAVGVGLFEGLYSYAEGNSVQTAIGTGLVAGALTFGGGILVGKLARAALPAIIPLLPPGVLSRLPVSDVGLPTKGLQCDEIANNISEALGGGDKIHVNPAAGAETLPSAAIGPVQGRGVPLPWNYHAVIAWPSIDAADAVIFDPINSLYPIPIQDYIPTLWPNGGVSSPLLPGG